MTDNNQHHDAPDDRDLNQWLFGRRRPRRQGRVWTSNTGDRKAEGE